MDGSLVAVPCHEREERCLDRMRAFERWYEFYLRKSQSLASNEDFSVNDIRVLQELFFAESGASGAWLAHRLDLDEGYLCRILQKLMAKWTWSSARCGAANASAPSGSPSPRPRARAAGGDAVAREGGGGIG